MRALLGKVLFDVSPACAESSCFRRFLLDLFKGLQHLLVNRFNGVCNKLKTLGFNHYLFTFVQDGPVVA